MNDDEAIRTLITTWLAATRDGDIDAVLALMTPDVVFLIPGQPTMNGRAAFEQSLRGVLASHHIDANSEIDEVVVSGDMAYTRTRLQLTVTPKDGGAPTSRTSQTLSILRKGSDGVWQLARDANMAAA